MFDRVLQEIDENLRHAIGFESNRCKVTSELRNYRPSRYSDRRDGIQCSGDSRLKIPRGVRVAVVRPGV